MRVLSLGEGGEVGEGGEAGWDDVDAQSSGTDGEQIAADGVKQGRMARVAGGVLLAVALASASVVALAGRAAPPPTGLHPLESPEFRQICHEQVRRLLATHDQARTLDEDALDAQIANAIGRFRGELATHLTPQQAAALAAARVTPGEWGTVGAALTMIYDGRLQRFGQEAAAVARSNATINSALELGLLAAARSGFNSTVVGQLLRESVPRRVRSALDAPPGGPAATAVAQGRMRAVLSAPSLALVRPPPAAPAAPRRLAAAPSWANPNDSDNLAIGITSFVFVTGAEVLLHLDLLCTSIELPVWLHSVLGVAALSLGITDCVMAFDFWCKWFFGAIGLNIVELIALLSGCSSCVEVKMDHLAPPAVPPLPPPAAAAVPGAQEVKKDQGSFTVQKMKCPYDGEVFRQRVSIDAGTTWSEWEPVGDGKCEPEEKYTESAEDEKYDEWGGE